MMTQFDTRIAKAIPRHLAPCTDHERTVERLRRERRRALWWRLMARLFPAVARNPTTATPISRLF